MAVSLTTAPLLVVPTKRVRISATLSGGGNFWRLWCVNAPAGSAMRAQLDASEASRIEVFSGDDVVVFETQLEVGGAWSFVAQEYTKGASTYGGGYQSDPASAPTETKIGGENNLTIHVGTRLTTRVGVASLGLATLTLWVFNATIQSTNLSIHGEETPSLTTPTTERARIALEQTAVQAAVAALAGVAAATALGAPGTMLADMVVKFADHFQDVGGAFHASRAGFVDANNGPATERIGTDLTTPSGQALAAGFLLRYLGNHQQNLSASGAEGGTPPTGYHEDAAGDPVKDTTNALTAGAPGSADQATLRAAIADLFQRYEAHRASGTYHGVTDGVNVLAGTLPLLLALDAAVLASLRAQTPPTPPTYGSGTVALIQGGGFSSTG